MVKVCLVTYRRTECRENGLGTSGPLSAATITASTCITSGYALHCTPFAWISLFQPVSLSSTLRSRHWTSFTEVGESWSKKLPIPEISVWATCPSVSPSWTHRNKHPLTRPFIFPIICDYLGGKIPWFWLGFSFFASSSIPSGPYSLDLHDTSL